MPAAIDPERRAAIVEAIRAGGQARAAIAREYGVSPRTVQRYADAAGIENPWDTTGTRAATAAARDHLRERRAIVSARFLDEADRMLDNLHGPTTVFAFGGKENEFNSAVLPDPPSGDVRNYMTAAAVAFDKHLAADKHDAGNGTEGAAELLAELGATLRTYALTGAVAEPPEDDEPDDEETSQ